MVFGPRPAVKGYDISDVSGGRRLSDFCVGTPSSGFDH